MKQLRNAIMRSFILYFLGLSIISEVLNELMIELDNWFFGTDYRLLTPILTLIFQILLILFFSFLFYRSLNKKIEMESQRLAKQQSTLFANIAHDLKTPLTSITGFSKALNEEIVESGEVKEVTDIIYHKSVTANALLDLMFQYTKLHSADFQLHKEECAINFLLKEVVAEYYDLIEKQQINLTLDIPDEPILCKVDAIEMRRVFSNLLINACTHNPPKTTLMIAVKRSESAIKLSFSDNGTAIPSKDRDTLFRPFVSENEDQRIYQGSGLGLAIVKTIIDKHHFSIELKDADGEVFTKVFELTL